MCDWFICKKTALQLFIERRILATNPLQHHHSVLLFFIAIVRKDSFKVVVLGLPLFCLLSLPQDTPPSTRLVNHRRRILWPHPPGMPH